MSETNYHKSDIEPLLQSRNSKQLQKQFDIVDEIYPDGVFTHLEFGCACGKLLAEWLERYPRAQFIGVDLDIEGKYEKGWPTLVRDYPNLKAMLKSDALDSSYIKSALLQHFGKEVVNIIHGHAAIMYLSDEKTHQFLHGASSYSQYIISRDAFVSEERFVGKGCVDSIRLLEKCCKNIDSVWSESIGRYVRPMTQHDTRGSSFTFQQFSDCEIFTADSKPSLKDRMASYNPSVANLLRYKNELGEQVLHEDYNEDTFKQLLDAFTHFGDNGEYCISQWVITLLKNQKAIDR